MINYTTYTREYSPEAEEEYYTDEEEGAVTFRDMLDILWATEPSEWPLPAEQSKGGYKAWYTYLEKMDPWTGHLKAVSYFPKTDRDSRWMRKAWHTINSKAGE